MADPKSNLRFPRHLDADAFLADHWQKKPLFCVDALPASLPRLDADELGWLATLPDVESRLVITTRTNGKTRYSVEYGPFDEKTLQDLPQQDWTLLVNDVDKHLPELRAWFSIVDYVPDWRIDDLMVSFAAPGGSVGPHVDNYDVFLCQDIGDRVWRLTDDARPAAESGELSLLEPFDATEEYCAEPGSVLYLPPGIAHWGIAKSACMTYSIGMRAPTRNELMLDMNSPDAEKAPEDAANDAELFYSDPDLTADEAQPGCISSRAVERALELFDSSVPRTKIAEELGKTVTDLKAWLAPDRPEDDQVESILQEVRNGKQIPLHGMARFAWHHSDEVRLVFVNGKSRRCDDVSADSLVELARNRVIDDNIMHLFDQKPSSDALLRWMFAQGIADLSETV